MSPTIYPPLTTEVKQPSLAAKPRIEFLDCLRGLAALYVVAHHLPLASFPRIVPPAWLEPLIHNGFTGVTLFFIISAFTLCLTLDGRQRAPHSTSNFYVRRLFRIVPLYYVWLAASFALAIVGRWGFDKLPRSSFDLLLYTGFGYNFFSGRQEGLVFSSWTLAVEMVFYAVFPFFSN
jgi:peptidoglycan/LPS O-acetylase OafA/YrhL